MNLIYAINQALKQTNHDELLRTMGYHNLNTGHKTLLKFINTDSIYLWLKHGNYDMKFNSEEFLQHLLKALDLTSVGKNELKQYKRRLDAIRAMRNRPYIFIDTHFKRKGESTFVLAILGSRRRIIPIDKEILVFKSEKEILEIIGSIVKNHYISSDGKLPLWGKIFTYIYHNTDGKKFIFNTDGTLSLNHHNITENRAELRIGNQIIEGII